MEWLKLNANENVDPVRLDADFLCFFMIYSKPADVAMFRDEDLNMYLWPSSSEIAMLLQHKYTFTPCENPNLSEDNLVIGEASVFEFIP